MPRHADLSPNIFLASPSDGSAWVSQISPDGHFWCTFFFYFVEGGGCIIEVVADVRCGIKKILRRGPNIKVNQSDASELRQWRSERLKADGLKYMQVDPVLVKKVLDNLSESCGQTLIDKEIWGQSWNTLNLCIYTLQFRHPDLVDEIRLLDLTRGTSSLSAKVSPRRIISGCPLCAKEGYTAIRDRVPDVSPAPINCLHPGDGCGAAEHLLV